MKAVKVTIDLELLLTLLGFNTWQDIQIIAAQMCYDRYPHSDLQLIIAGDVIEGDCTVSEGEQIKDGVIECAVRQVESKIKVV